MNLNQKRIPISKLTINSLATNIYFNLHSKLFTNVTAEHESMDVKCLPKGNKSVLISKSVRLKSYQFKRLSMIVSFINVKIGLSMSFFREYITLKRGIPIV